MKICPNCGRVLSYNSYFGAYICDACSWEEVSKGTKNQRLFYYLFPSKKNQKQQNYCETYYCI